MAEEPTCRLCAGISDPGVSLLDPALHTLVKFAEINLGLKFPEENGLPTRVCISCIKNIQVWKKFRDKCETSRNLFTSRIVHVASKSLSNVTSHQEITSSTGLTSLESQNCDVSSNAVTPPLSTAEKHSNATGNENNARASKRNNSLRNWLIVKKTKIAAKNKTDSNPVQFQENSDAAVDVLQGVRVISTSNTRDSGQRENATSENTTNILATSSQVQNHSVISLYNLKDLRVNLTRLNDSYIQSLKQVKTESLNKQDRISCGDNDTGAMENDNELQTEVRSNVSRSKGMKQENSSSTSGSDIDIADNRDDNFYESSEDEEKFAPEEHLVKIEKLSIPNTFVSTSVKTTKTTQKSSLRSRRQIPNSDIEKMQRIRTALRSELEKRSFRSRIVTSTSEPTFKNGVRVQGIDVRNSGDSMEIVAITEPDSNPASPLQEPSPEYESESEHEHGVTKQVTTQDLQPSVNENQLSTTDKEVQRRQVFKSKKQQKTLEESKICNRTYYCAHCNFKTNRKFNLILHLITKNCKKVINQNKKRFKCFTCSTSFKRRCHLAQHIFTVHSDARPYKCDLCSKTYKTREHCTRHLKTAHTKERPFKCEICSKTFKIREDYRTHEKRVHIDVYEYKCDICTQMFKKRVDCAQHMRTVHSDKRPFQCEICKKSYKTRGAYKEHKSMVHLNIYQYACDICSKMFKQKSYCERHKLIVHGTNNRPFKCDVCSKTFKLKLYCAQHKRMVHSNDRPFKCESCSKSFKSLRNYKVHKAKSHTNVYQYKCNICSKMFKYLENCKRHEASVHSDKRPFVCDICYKTFKLKAACDSHKKFVHTNVKPFHCEICSKSFKNQNHKKIAHSDIRPYKCKICCKSFKILGNYKRHMSALHTNDLKCKICSKYFNSRAIYNEHMSKIHLNALTLKCDHCSKTFLSRSNCISHMLKIHLVGKPVQCNICKKSYKSVQYLKRHVNFVHNSKPIFKCETCSKMFKSKCILQRHIVIHSEISPFNCEECGRSFKLKNLLNSHLITHKLDRPYKCNNCDSCFKSKHALKDHSVIHSSSFPFKCSKCTMKFKRKQELKMHMLRRDHSVNISL